MSRTHSFKQYLSDSGKSPVDQLWDPGMLPQLGQSNST
jgi:hypothetical protein